MYETKDSESNATKYATTVERKSERELVVTRSFNGPAHIVFDAWTKPELVQRWWAPKSFGVSFLSCEADARTGGKYRFVFSHASSEQPMTFFGRYVEVIPHSSECLQPGAALRVKHSTVPAEGRSGPKTSENSTLWRGRTGGRIT
jgi:hypothetical protein